MARPVLVAMYADPKVLTALDQALQTRFGADYQAHPRQARARHLPSRAVATSARRRGVEFGNELLHARSGACIIAPVGRTSRWGSGGLGTQWQIVMPRP